jgi:NAD(P)H dehydrogenase (quinone)
MRHLIVVAHPIVSSVTIKLGRAYAEELERLGHMQTTHDLYRMGFNPVMGADELEPLQNTSRTPADVLDAQAAVQAADVVTMVYPFWWAAMPAMLKGYIDRVFARGFSYEATNGVNTPLLTGKRCVLITLSGSPMSLLHENGQWRAIKLLQDDHVFGSSGFEILEHLHFDRVEAPIPDRTLQSHIAQVRACARRHFASAGAT